MEFVFRILQLAGLFVGIFGTKSIVILLLRNKPKSIKQTFDTKGNLVENEITYRDFRQ